MSSYYCLCKLDTGEFITTKNLDLDRLFPSQTPFVIESLITRDEFISGLTTRCRQYADFRDEEIAHLVLIVEAVMVWSRSERVIVLHEDQQSEWVNGETVLCGLDISQFRPLVIPTIQAFWTADADAMREFLANTR